MNEDQITPQEFAAKIKSKYPQYQDMDDLELTNKMLEKYPQYKDMISLDKQQGGVSSFAKTLQSTVSDLIPQSVVGYVQREVGQYKKNINNPTSILNNVVSATSSDENLKQLQDQNQISNLQLQAEKYIGTQKQEAQQKLKGVTQNYKDIHNLSSLSSYIGQALGQGIGQIPAALVTQGASSYLMEASEIYDTQLDLLAKKHDISREEVIKRGLDKPAEGEAFAILAAALDTFSAGQVLGLFKKQATKELTKEVTENTLKEIGKNFIKSAGVEFGTEASQGVLEKLGAAKGAGVEANINPSDIINEGLSGAIGGGGISVVSNSVDTALKKKNQHPANDVIDSHNELINNIKVGDPAIDASLDELSIYNSQELNKLFDKAKEITGEIEGTKQQDQIKAVLDEYEKTLQEKQSLERTGYLQDLFKQFEKSPTVLQQHPVSEENELGPQVEEIDYSKLHPEPFKLTETEVPKYDPNTLDEIGTQKAKEFTLSNYAGEAKGTIVNNSASLDTIYANKDKNGNPIVGGKLYETLIDNLKQQGVNRLRVGMQSPASTQVLSKLVNKGILEVDPKGNVVFGDQTIHTQFNILQNKPEVKSNDTQNESRIQSSIGIRQEPIQPEPISRRGSSEITPSRIFQASQKIEEARREEEIKAQEQQDKIRQKIEKNLESALKRRPAAKLARLEELASIADENKLEDLKKHIATLADREVKRQEKTAEFKEIHKKAAIKKAENTKSKEERAEERKIKLEERKEKQAAKKINKPVEGTVVGKGTAGERSATIKEAKEGYLKEIAYQRFSGNPKYKNIAKAYIKFRESQNLKPVTEEQAIKQAEAEAYTVYAKKQLEKESHERGSIQRKIASMKKEGKSAEEIAKANEQLYDQIKGSLAKILNIKQSDIENLSGYNLSELFTKDVKDMLGEAFDKNKIKRSSVSEIINTLKKNDSIKGRFSQDLLLAVEKALAKNKKELVIYEYDNSKPAGLHLIGKNLDVILLTKGALGNTERQSSTILHEIIHGYMSVFASTAFQSNESFARSINRVYDSGKESYIKSIKSIMDKLLTKARTATKNSITQPFVEFTKDNLSEYEFNILNATWDYINEFYDSKRESNYLSNFMIGFMQRINLQDKFRNATTSKAMVEGLSNEIVKHVYGFTNQRELLAEGLSSNAFANLLNQIAYESNVIKYKEGKKANTILQKIFDELRRFVKENIFGTPSVYDELQHILEDFDELYQDQHTNINGIVDPVYKSLTMGDLRHMKEYKGVSSKELNNLLKLSLDVMSEDELYEADLKKAPLKKMPNLSKDISDNISKTLERRKEITSLKDVREYIERVNKNLGEERKLGEFFVEEVWKKIQAMRAARKTNLTRYEDAVKQARKNPKYYQSKQFAKNVEDFASVELNNLNLNKLKTITKGIESLSENGNVGQEAFNLMITHGKEFTKKKELLKVADKIAKSTSTLVADFSNPSSYSSILGRYNKNTASTILKNVYGGLMETYSNIALESKQFFDELSHLADKYNLIHPNLARIGMYGSIFSTKSDPNNKAEWNKEVSENAKFLVESAENKIKADEKGKYRGDLSKKALTEELKIAKDLEDKINKSLSMDGILSKEEKELYDKFREFAIKHEDDFKRNSIAVWGNNNYVSRFNYFPTMAQGKVEGVLKGDFKADELLNGPEDNLAEALGVSNNKIDKNNIYGKKVWSNYQRLNPKGYFYEFDALGIADKWSHKMLFDLYASVEMKALNRLMRDSELHEALGEKVVKGFLKQLKSIAGVGHQFREDIHWSIKKLLKTRDLLYTTTLATTGQLLSQSASGFGAAAIISANAGVKAPLVFSKAVSATMKSSFSSDTSKLQQFLKENGLGIQLRDILFEKYLSPEDYLNYINKKGKKFTNAIQNASEWGLRAGDKLGARIVWFAAYFNAGGTLENPSKEAVLEAERWVGMMQNMSDINFSAPAFKYDSTAKKLLFQTFYAFKAFAVNSYINTVYSLKNIKSPEARTVLAGQLASIAAYHAMAEFAVKPLYDLIVNNLMGDDDDDDDKEKEISLAQKAVAETLWDIGGGPFFGMASVPMSDAFFRYMFNATVAPKIYPNPDPFATFDKYNQSPLYSPKELDDVWKQAFGPGAKDILGLMIESGKIVEIQANTNDYFLDIDKADRLELQKQLYYYQVASFLAGISPSVPLRGDAKKLMENYARKLKAQYLKEHPKGSGKGTNSVEGEESIPVEPEFQEQNYEIINQ